MNRIRAALTPARRRRLYEVGIAGLAVLVGYGVVQAEHAVLWSALLIPVLGIARDNVPGQ